MTRTKHKLETEEAPEIAFAESGPLAPVDEEAHEVEAERWPPTGPLVVYEGQHNAPATILKANDDRTLDLSADLHGLGHEMTLYGVQRRQGAGNGWEPA